MTNPRIYLSLLISITTLLVCLYLTFDRNNLIYLILAGVFLLTVVSLSLTVMRNKSSPKVNNFWSVLFSIITVSIVLFISLANTKWLGWPFIAGLSSFITVFPTSQNEENK